MVGLLRGDTVDWRWASASVIGTSHIKSGDRLQDAYIVSELGNGCLLALVSDGAGSAKFGAYGAWLTCRSLSLRFREWFRNNKDLPSNEELTYWIDDLRDKISTIAERRNSTSRQFAATLAAIVISPNESVTIHIGDSAIVGRKISDWDVLCWPENGEYASSTYFVTDNPEARLNITRHPPVYDAFVVFSDGIGDLALSYSQKAAYSRFLDPMLRPVDANPDKGHLAELSTSLATYLLGKSVCERTDDDKTLILISGI